MNHSATSNADSRAVQLAASPADRWRAVAIFTVLALLATLVWTQTQPGIAAAMPGTGIVSARVNAGGPQVAAADGGMPWAADSAATPSPYRIAGGPNTFTTTDAITLTDPSVPAGTPQSLFQTERWNSASESSMVWEFPVSSGVPYEVNLYLAEIFGTADGFRSFTVNVEGAPVLVDYDIHSNVGADAGVVVRLISPTVADDALTITFEAVTQNPKVSAIEVRSTDEDPTPIPDPPIGPDPSVAFSASGLAGENLNNPTSLDFGPDGRLYVVQQNGTIFAYDIDRASPNNYAVAATETIDLIKNNTPNHNDDGSSNPTNIRQSTGLVTAGTAANPVLYVSSSDWRIGGGGSGNDEGLDTNSGVISRLTWTGSAWDKVDLVRGLPRSEENHATNGMALDENTNTLYVMQGGHANKGAPSNNFSGTPEYFLAAALLSVDLDAIDALPVQTSGGVSFVYDLPTLDDPTRGVPGQPDPGDPFGGNNGLNQAIPEPGGPVQIHSPGYRNAYDVVLTEAGELYTFDNGPNTNWGGLPTAGPGNTCTNELNEAGSSGHGDTLHHISEVGYYGGHPAPIRAFPATSGIYVYEQAGSTWNQIDFRNFGDLLPAGLSINDFPNNPVECEYLADSATKYLDIINSSTNGIAEYTASNFDGSLQGNLLAAAFNGNIYRYALNADGTDTVQDEVLFSGFGQTPLDVIAQGDNDPFAGSVWAATYGSDSITIFEPQDFGTVVCTGADNNTDEDDDGFTNADEIDNGTNPCSGGSSPADNDGDFVSDLNDTDDDNDGVLDVNDPFAIDADNGLSTALPVARPFANGDGGFFGLGFTGLMTNGETDWRDQFDEGLLDAGGATEKLGISDIPEGDAYQAVNTQMNAFQFGIDADSSTDPFVVRSTLQAPFFDGAVPVDFASAGIQIGTGDQDNYIKFVMRAAGGTGGLEVLREVDGIVSNSGPAASLLDATEVELQLVVDPAALTVQPRVSIDAAPLANAGPTVAIPAAWLSATDDRGLAVGLISTSTGPAAPFNAVWDNLDVEFVDITPTPPTPTPPTLTDGAAVTGLTGNAGSEQLFSIDVPAGTTELSVTMTGSGDADLYVHPGVRPTQQVWTCRPYIDGSSNEACTITAPAAGTWFVMVRGWAAFDATTLTASLSSAPTAPTPTPTPTPPTGGNELTSGVPVAGLSGPAGSEQFFSIDVPANATELSVSIAGTGDADLYIHPGTNPTQSVWTCRPYVDGSSNEDCTISAPAAGTWFVMVRGWAAFDATTLTATVNTTAPDGNVLSSGVPVAGLSGVAGQEIGYTITVPAGASQLVVQMTGSGDADLYVKSGSAPTPAVWDCRPYIDGSSSETCTIAAPAPGTWFVTARGWASFSNVSLTATVTP